MEILWSTYGSPMEQHADNRRATRYQRAIITPSTRLNNRAYPGRPTGLESTVREGERPRAP
jgi:hypothetical protein